MLGERGRPVFVAIEYASHVLFEVMFFIVKLAPLGVLGAIAFTVGKYGVGSLAQLGFLVLIFYVSCALFVLLVLGAVMRFVGFSIVKFLRFIREELLIVLGTASSDAVLPQLMRKLKGLGVGESTVGLVIPPATRSTSTASRSTCPWPRCSSPRRPTRRSPSATS